MNRKHVLKQLHLTNSEFSFQCTRSEPQYYLNFIYQKKKGNWNNILATKFQNLIQLARTNDLQA
jgi:hypothetical protein